MFLLVFLFSFLVFFQFSVFNNFGLQVFGFLLFPVFLPMVWTRTTPSESQPQAKAQANAKANA